MNASKTLLIVYHSMTGGTRQMAEAARDGVAAEGQGVQVRLLHACEAGPDDVLSADGYLFATPENLAAISGQLKDFFDRSYYAALDRINGRPYASLICAGSDGQNAARQIARIATGWRLKPVAEPLIICTHAQTTEAILAPKRIAAAELEQCRALGKRWGRAGAGGVLRVASILGALHFLVARSPGVAQPNRRDQNPPFPPTCCRAPCMWARMPSNWASSGSWRRAISTSSG